MAYLSQFLRSGDINITPAEESTLDLTNAAANAGYSKDSRTGTTSSKNGTYELDTTEYDSKITELQNQIAAAQQAAAAAKRNASTPSLKNKAYNAVLNKYNYSGLQSQLSDMQTNKQNYLNSNANKTTLDASTTQADQALQSAQQSSQGTAVANRAANINAGINKSAAGLLGSQASSNDTASTATNQYAGNKSTAASTQADYLEKMAQADALDQQASNMSKSAGLAALSGGLSGAGTGASMGAVISDENAKQPSDGIDDNQLIESIKQFKTLYAKVKKLRGDK